MFKIRFFWQLAHSPSLSWANSRIGANFFADVGRFRFGPWFMKWKPSTDCSLVGWPGLASSNESRTKTGQSGSQPDPLAIPTARSSAPLISNSPRSSGSQPSMFKIFFFFFGFLQFGLGPRLGPFAGWFEFFYGLGWRGLDVDRSRSGRGSQIESSA